MHLAIIEIIPSIIVSDGSHTIEAIFTKESINDLRRSSGALGLSKLRDKVIQVNQWSLQIDSVDSLSNYMSYQNISIRIVIEQFTPKMSEVASAKILTQPRSVFKNEGIRTLISSHRHWLQ